MLLVEDDPTSRGFLRAAAAALPAHVDVAGSVADARVMATRETYDAWLIDAHLPDGSELINYTKRKPLEDLVVEESF